MDSVPTWWNILELAGIWFAAAATFYAARTAIKLSRSENKVELIPEVETGFFLMNGTNNVPMINFSVKNVGTRTVQVKSFAFEHAGLNGGQLALFLGHSMDEVQLPFMIEFSDSKTFFMERNSGEDWFKMFARELVDGQNAIWRWRILRSLRITVQIGTGQRFSAKPKKGFMQQLKRAVHEITSKGENT